MKEVDLTGVEKILCVAAHPDDLEYGISCAVAAWTEAGITVDYLLLTAGEAGMQRPPEVVGPLRSQEQREACDIVGARDLTILDFPDGHMEPGLPVRTAIAKHIRAHRPDMVVTSNYDIEVPWGFNHVDHRVTGVAVGDAIRDAGNRWFLPEEMEGAGEPWAVPRMLVGGVADPDVYVDVTGEPLEKGIASLAAHKEYLADLPDHPEPREMLTQSSQGVGGVEHGIAFKQWAM